MSKQAVNIGTTANDGTGSPLRSAFDFINDNTDELYNLLGDGSTLSITGDVSVSAGAVTIANDAVDHDQLADRFTAKQDITTTTGTINLDASSYGIFEFTSDLTGAATLNIQNIKKGQVIDILISGSQTITFSADFTTEAFNKLAEVDYDGANDNHIQVICIDDTDSDAILNYSIASYASDTTP